MNQCADLVCSSYLYKDDTTTVSNTRGTMPKARHRDIKDVEDMQALYEGIRRIKAIKTSGRKEGNGELEALERAAERAIEKVAAGFRNVAMCAPCLRPRDGENPMRKHFENSLVLLGRDQESMKRALEKSKISIGLDCFARKSQMSIIEKHFPTLNESEE